MRERCYDCFRPKQHCFCHAIPTIDNRTDILILQHVGERFHAFNTARIVRKALNRCFLSTNHNQRFELHQLPIQPNAGLLYPDDDALDLAELTPTQRPKQLVIIDGTWHQAKTIVRDVPQLRELPRYRLAPTSPGQYRIRREPNAFSLSTLEATVAALRALEPETKGLDQLLTAFHTMVENQMGHPASHAAWRRKKSRGTRPRFIPQSMLQQPANLVVAYGEATPRQPNRQESSALPINWFAHRIGTNEQFDCTLQPTAPLPQGVLRYLRLQQSDFDNAVTHEEFSRRWRSYLHPHDVLVVYHQRTFELLRRIDPQQPSCLVLKSIFGKWQSDFRSIDELLSAEGIPRPVEESCCRAESRMQMAVALVEHLRAKHLRSPRQAV